VSQQTASACFHAALSLVAYRDNYGFKAPEFANSQTGNLAAGAHGTITVEGISIASVRPTSSSRKNVSSAPRCANTSHGHTDCASTVRQYWGPSTRTPSCSLPRLPYAWDVQLEFDRTKQMLVWNTKSVPVKAGTAAPAVPKNGTLRLPVPKPVFVDIGTWPKGSTWARDPIPRVQDGRSGLHPHTPECSSGEGRSGGPGCYAFPAPCPFDSGILPCDGTATGGYGKKGGGHCDGDGMGACSSDFVVGLISDEVIIPKELDPGHWVPWPGLTFSDSLSFLLILRSWQVLSWRWDCE
jgi:hypothetical protein